MVYLGGIAFQVILYWDDLTQGTDRIYLLAAVFGVSAGVASATAILVEVIGRMVLLIPDAVKKLIEKGRQEGRQEGLQEGRQEGRQEGLQEGLQQERREWETWLSRLNQARAENRPFDEPPPSQRM